MGLVYDTAGAQVIHMVKNGCKYHSLRDWQEFEINYPNYSRFTLFAPPVMV